VARAASAPMELDCSSLTGAYFTYWSGVPTDGAGSRVLKVTLKR
jgi:hypothetical protein